MARIPDDDTRAAAMRLADLIQCLMLDQPLTVYAIERVARALTAEQRRQSIAQRLERIDPEGLAEIDALLREIERTQGGRDPSSLDH